MDYQIAIPTYRRPTIFRDRTLNLLLEAEVPHDRITVFVASQHEADTYRPHVPSTIRIVVGVLGLVNQRAFIQKYYTEGERILFVDDDIQTVQHLVDPSGVKLEKASITELAAEGWRRLAEEGGRIWGVYPCPAGLYMKSRTEITTSLCYIIGALYGVINTGSPPALLYGDNQEDKERTLRYFVADGRILRLNRWSICTRFYAPGGMDSPTRKAETDAATKILEDEFPDLVSRMYKGRQQIWDLRFGRLGRRPRLPVPVPVPPPAAEEDTVTRLSKRSDYEQVRDTLLTALRQKSFKPRKLVITKDPHERSYHGTRGDVVGAIGHSVTFGYGNTRSKGPGEYVWNTKYPDILRALIHFGNHVVPPGFEYSAITLNKGVKAQKHKDGGNVGRSVIVGIGNYKGGELRVWDSTGTEALDYDLSDQPLFFNGALRFHETQPFEGERWTIIYYKYKYPGVCKDMPRMCGLVEGDSEVDLSGEEVPVRLRSDYITHE